MARWLGEDATESLAMGTEVRRVAAATLRHGAELSAAGEGDLALPVPMGAVIMALDSEPDPRARVQVVAALAALAAARARLGEDAVLPLRRLLLATALADLSTLAQELHGGSDVAAAFNDSGDENETETSESCKPLWAPRLRTRALAATLLARLPVLCAGSTEGQGSGEWVGVGLRLATNDAAAVRPAGAELLAYCADALCGEAAVEFQAQFIAGTRALAAPGSAPPLRAAACRIAATLVEHTKVDADEPAVVSRLAAICGSVLLSDAAPLPASAEIHSLSLYAASASASARLANAAAARGDAIAEAAAQSLAKSSQALKRLWVASVKEHFAEGRDVLGNADASDSLLSLARHAAASGSGVWAWPQSSEPRPADVDADCVSSLVVAAASRLAAAAAAEARSGNDFDAARVFAVVTTAGGALSRCDPECAKALVIAAAALADARPGDPDAVRAAAAVAAGSVSTQASGPGTALAIGIVSRGGKGSVLAVNACRDHAAARPFNAAALALVCAQALLKLDSGSSSNGDLEKFEILSGGVRQCLLEAPEPVKAGAAIAAELASACKEPSRCESVSCERASQLGVEIQCFVAESVSAGQCIGAISDAALSSAAESIRLALTGPASEGSSPRRRDILAGFRSALARAGPGGLVEPAAIARYVVGVWGAEVVASAVSAGAEDEGESPSSEEALKLLLSLARALPPAEQSVVLVALVGALIDCASNSGEIAKRLLGAVISGAAQVDRDALKGALATLDEAQKLRLAQCMKPPAAPNPAASAAPPASPTGGLRPPPIGRPPAISLKRF